MDTNIPFQYILAVALNAALIAEAIYRFAQPWTKPAIAVYFTIAAWYLLDFMYNGAEGFVAAFRGEIIGAAFIEVMWFLIVYRFAVGRIAHATDPDAEQSITPRADNVSRLFLALVVALAVLLLIGLVRVDGDYMNLIYPPAADEFQPLFVRGGVGQGLDFLISTAGYVHLAVVGMIGILITVSPTLRQRLLALAVFVAALPPFAFQRARNVMLAVIMPGLLAFLLNGRYSPVLRLGGAAGVFAVINFWFFVIGDYRGKGHDWSQVSIGNLGPDAAQKHQGLDMFGELCHINTFIENGVYDINYGERYFAEVVAVVPRTIWPSKPFCGIDYSIARGFGSDLAQAGVTSSVATGMIGQGVVNFGPIFGPVAAAVIMAFWSRILTGLWLQRANFAKLGLFMLGLGLTFNLGRDITTQVLFPFIFIAIAIHVVQRLFGTR